MITSSLASSADRGKNIIYFYKPIKRLLTSNFITFPLPWLGFKIYWNPFFYKEKYEQRESNFVYFFLFFYLKGWKRAGDCASFNACRVYENIDP